MPLGVLHTLGKLNHDVTRPAGPWRSGDNLPFEAGRSTHGRLQYASGRHQLPHIRCVQANGALCGKWYGSFS
jgi:hypothetical protein